MYCYVKNANVIKPQLPDYVRSVGDNLMVDLLRERDEWEQLKESIALLREEIAEIRNSKPVEPLSQQSPIQPYQQPIIPQATGMGALTEFIDGMTKLRGYDSKVREEYRQQLQDVAIEAVEGIEPDSATDKMLLELIRKIDFSKLGTQPKAQANEAQQDTPDVSPLPPVPIQQTEVAKVEINKDILMEQIPNYIKIGIRSGELTLQQLKGFVMPEMQKRGIPITEQLIEEIYNEVKNDKTPEDRGINIQAHKTSKSEGGKAKKGKKADK